MTSTTNTPNEKLPAAMQSDLVQKLMWSGLVPLIGAITAIVARELAEQTWLRVIGSDPPID